MRPQHADAGGFRHGAKVRHIGQHDGAARAQLRMSLKSGGDVRTVIGDQRQVGILKFFVIGAEHAGEIRGVEISQNFLAKRCVAPA